MEAPKQGHDTVSGSKASSSSRKTIALDKKNSDSPNTTNNKQASIASTSSVVTSPEKAGLKKPKKGISKNKGVDAKSGSTTKLNTGKQQTIQINQEQRIQLIATAAYLRAEKRGFMGGDPVEDWLQAESEVDASLV